MRILMRMYNECTNKRIKIHFIICIYMLIKIRIKIHLKISIDTRIKMCYHTNMKTHYNTHFNKGVIPCQDQRQDCRQNRE